MKVTTLDKTVAELLKQLYFIPRFQRPFDWDKEQVEQFWNDTVIENTGDYFIGSVVLYNSGDSFGIVDGQQRITTIVMILCALRNAFGEASLSDEQNGLHGIIERKDIDNKTRFVLKTDTSAPFFQDKILNDGPPNTSSEPENPEEELLAETAGYLRAWIADAVAHQPVKKEKTRTEEVLKRLRDRILGLKLITVELDNEDDAYLIFETLNTRGKDLQVSHLLKNLLSRLLKAKNKDLDALKIEWTKLLEIFETSQIDLSVDTFLHHYWLSTSKYVTAKKLFVSIKKTVTTAAQAKTLLDLLLKDASLYRAIYEPSYRKWKKEEESLRRSLYAISSVFRMRQPYPFLLSVMRCYRDGLLSKKNVASVLRAVESFHLAFTAVASMSSSGGVSLMYASWAQSLCAASTQAQRQAVLVDAKARLRSKMPSKADFVAGFLSLRNSDEYTKSKKLVRYILAAVHDELSPAGVVADHEQMTVEHVASQNPPPGATPAISPDHVAMIGNQVMVDLALQEKLKNKAVPDKIKILRNAKLATVDEIIAAPVWDDKAIEKRTTDLAVLAYDKIWKF